MHNYLIFAQSNENKTKWPRIIDATIQNAESKHDALNTAIQLFESRTNQTNKTIHCQIFIEKTTEPATSKYDLTDCTNYEYPEHALNIVIDPTIPKCINIKNHSWIEVLRESRKWDILKKQRIIHICKLCYVVRTQKTQTKRVDIIFTEIKYDISKQVL